MQNSPLTNHLLVCDAGTLALKVVVFREPAIDGCPETPGKECVHPCISKSVHHNRLPAQSRRNTVTMNLVFIISHFLCFSKIFFIYFSGVFLCDKAHENVRSVQFAVKYCGERFLTSFPCPVISAARS